jgi:hypothetical protein
VGRILVLVGLYHALLALGPPAGLLLGLALHLLLALLHRRVLEHHPVVGVEALAAVAVQALRTLLVDLLLQPAHTARVRMRGT